MLLVGIAARAGAQDPRLARLDPTTRSAVVDILDSARARSLPLEPLIDRALEGATKGASAPIIVAALWRLAGDLAKARTLLGPDASAAEIDAGAAALRAGAAPSLIGQLRQERQPRSLVVPLAVLADLVASGVPAGDAARAVVTLAAATDEQLVEFRRSVERDIALGAPPAAATAVRVNATARDVLPRARRP